MNDCIFCKIAAGTIPARKLFEDEAILAFHDATPQAPVHFLLIPRKHIPNILELGPEDEGLLERLLNKARELAVEQGCGEGGARFVINCKADGGQSVDHLHVHVLGGRALGWPPG
ncbi:MAG: histidine triad nucleotide-binding protein [Treponema sp.]|jgi:histidine triad (HIT) family protein|nr:histidine triad nucleotide-binding protein [Treponema sp.]